MRTGTKRWLAGSVLAVALGMGADPLRAEGPDPSERGFQPTGSYQLSDIETVNSKNGNVLLRVPLTALPPGRGGNPGFQLTLNYNSKLWDIYTHADWKTYFTPGEDPRFQRKVIGGAFGTAGWRYNFDYLIDVEDRTSYLDSSRRIWCPGSGDDPNTQYSNMEWHRFKVRMVFPDGSVHVFRPEGEFDPHDDDYFRILPTGWKMNDYGHCETTIARGWTAPAAGSKVRYYSADGTYLRLEFEADSPSDASATLYDITRWENNPWTLTFPDGRQVKGTGKAAKYLIDRNGNEVSISRIDDYNDTGNMAVEIRDDLNRTILVEMAKDMRGNKIRDTVSQTGGNGQQLTWTVDWGPTKASRDYYSQDSDQNNSLQFICTDLTVVTRITLPTQLAGLTYQFGYNGTGTRASCYSDPDSTGFGELSEVRMPWGASAAYGYALDYGSNDEDEVLSTPDPIARNTVRTKTVTYTSDGSAVTENWAYNISPNNSAVMTVPGGGKTREMYNTAGLLVKVEQCEESSSPVGATHCDGSSVTRTVERIWGNNTLDVAADAQPQRPNPYVQNEFTTVTGTTDKTAIKSYSYDSNGNLKEVDEYAWVDSGIVPRFNGVATGIPQRATAKRRTVHTYHAGASADAYYKSGAPRLLAARKSTEIREGTVTRRSRREFTYGTENAYARTTGNLTEEKIGLSNEFRVVPATLIPSNSITILHTYDSHGNRTSTTDGRGIRTEWTYGDIDAGGDDTEDDLYPTAMVAAAGNTSLRKTTNYSYDFWTGAVTSVKDVDNGVTTLTELDAVGRPIVVKEAAGKAEERQTRTWYCDSQRRLIVRSDLAGDAGDGELLTVTDYDQLGRVSQARSWESGAPASPTYCGAYGDESDSDRDVIKVKTSYSFSGTRGYTITSNPHRKAATTGWTRTELDHLGRVVELGHFGGATQPSTTATPTLGKTTTGYDAEFTTVTDADGKSRRSQLDSLGRLVRVDEPDSSGDLEDSNGSAVQSTAYAYDALGNLTGVTQGSQTRSFAYDSLSRLRSARNPESGTIAYTYDNNGNLTERTDARGVEATYSYDALNRLTGRSYSYTGTDTAVSLETTRVDYDYDNCGAYSDGRLCSVTAKKGTAVVSKTAYANYDALGRVGKSTQTTGNQDYTMRYSYDRAGNLISQTYPSGKVVETVYDEVGRVAGVKRQDGSWYAGAAAGATGAIGYEPHGGIRQFRLGNLLWEERRYNRRLQPTQIGLGTARTTAATLDTATSPRLLLDYSYGTTTNNGNVASQQIRVGTLDLTQSYAYDKLNRLTGATERRSGTPTWSQTYQYDVYGNRAVTAGRNHGSTPALTPSALTSFNASSNRLLGGAAYDGAGNLTLDWGGRRFKYDGDNRMVSFDTTGVNTDATYQYDGEGRRVKRVVGGVTTTYVYNVSGQLVAEYATSGTPLAGIRYLTTDHLGSTRVVTQAVVSGPDGGVVSRHDYLPFGEEIGSLGGRTAALKYSASGTAQKFTGKERDNESGLDYFGARYFSGAEGRFTSVDPENASGDPADPQSWNGYAYARNNPLLYVDPDGRYFVVCQSDGDCTTYAVDSEFYRFLREEKLQFDPETDEDGNLLPTNIYSVDERGNKTLYGQAFHSRHAPGLGDEGVGPLELALGTGLTSLARKAVRNLFRGKGTARSSTATDLGSLGRSGSSKKIREVVGDSGDALKLFDKLRGNNPVREIKPGIFVAKGKTGGHVTFRPSSKSGPPTVDVHGLEPGGRKIKFVPE